MVQTCNLGLLMWEEGGDKKLQEISWKPLPLGLGAPLKLKPLLLARATLCGCLCTMLYFADPDLFSGTSWPDLRAALSIWTCWADMWSWPQFKHCVHQEVLICPTFLSVSFPHISTCVEEKIINKQITPYFLKQALSTLLLLNWQ